MKKTGVSTVIAIVLIVLMSVAAVTILFSFVIPVVNENLESLGSKNIEFTVLEASGYTVWDNDLKILSVHLSRGDDNQVMSDLLFRINPGPGGVELSYSDAEQHSGIIGPGQAKRYGFYLADRGITSKPSLVQVYAVVGGNEILVAEILSNDLDNSTTQLTQYLPCEFPELNEGTRICDCEALQDMKDSVSDTYTLGRDIDCSDSRFWNPQTVNSTITASVVACGEPYGGECGSGTSGFEPIGTEGEPFIGELRGKGHTISGVWINRSDEDDVGMFGFLSGATITDVEFEDFTIVGGNNVGVIGEMENTDIGGIELIDLQITGTDKVGMLAGVLDTSSIADVTGNGMLWITGQSIVTEVITQDSIDPQSDLINANVDLSETYEVDIVGNDYVGGLFGQVICYNPDGIILQNINVTGDVMGGNHIGGLIGKVTMIDGYFNISNVHTDLKVWGGDATTGAFIGSIAPFGTERTDLTVRIIDSSWTQHTVNSKATRPVGQVTSVILELTNVVKSCAPDAVNCVPDNACTSDQTPGVTTICTCEDLQGINLDLEGDYILMKDINCEDVDFEPIGDSGCPSDRCQFPNPRAAFTGTLNGQGHVISNLAIRGVSDETGDGVGLFSLAEGATIERVGLENINVRGRYDVGGFIGMGDSNTLRNVWVNGSVSGSAQVGSIVGSNSNSIIEDSYSSAGVYGADSSGGLVGNAEEFQIINSFATGVLPQDYLPGGLIGQGYSVVIVNSYWYDAYASTPESQEPYPSTGALYCVGGSNKAGCTKKDSLTWFYSNNYGWDEDVWSFSGSDYPTLE